MAPRTAVIGAREQDYSGDLPTCLPPYLRFTPGPLEWEELRGPAGLGHTSVSPHHSHGAPEIRYGEMKEQRREETRLGCPSKQLAQSGFECRPIPQLWYLDASLTEHPPQQAYSATR